MHKCSRDVVPHSNKVPGTPVFFQQIQQKHAFRVSDDSKLTLKE